jgi:hypothetical protein
MPFHTFNQNNSGGAFVITDDLAMYVIVEGANIDQIVERAQALGIYFDGCETGEDCPCCGDRWDMPWRDELSEQPEVYGELVVNSHVLTDSLLVNEDAFGVIHYLDGTRVRFYREDASRRRGNS